MDQETIQQIDQLLSKNYPPDGPGASVIITKDGQVLFRKGYGKAHLELGVDIEPHMVFRLGSITKQFTAVAILMLVEQGKLNLTDELATLLPGYPTQGKCVTLEHLLTHTSGIKSYTSLPEWLPLWRKDMSLTELIDLFKDKPYDFEPGEKFLYNNSGYILLGAIIERVTGISYAEYIQKQIFEPLGMVNSLYDKTETVVPKRVAGYQRVANGYENAAYLSMSQPYAAGSLASSVDDLALWDSSLYTGKLVSPELLAKAFTSFRLNNGAETGYGYGWQIGKYEGFSLIQHGGGINGFSTGGIRIPEEKLYVALLTNCENPPASPDALVFKVAAIALGRPMVEPTPITLPQEALEAYVGIYQVSENEERTITVQDGKITSQRTGGMKLEIFPFAPDRFFIKDNPDQFEFLRDEQGKIIGMKVIRLFGPEEHAPKTDKALPEPRQAIILEPGQMARFVGVYELAPGVSAEIFLAEGNLFLQVPGQEKLPLFAESAEKVFAREFDLSVTFEFDDQGALKSCVLKQGPAVYPLKKTR